MTARIRNAFNPACTARLALGVSGTVAVAIAGTILFAPEAFHGSSGMPDSGMVSAPANELFIGVICEMTLDQARRFSGTLIVHS